MPKVTIKAQCVISEWKYERCILDSSYSKSTYTLKVLRTLDGENVIKSVAFDVSLIPNSEDDSYMRGAMINNKLIEMSFAFDSSDLIFIKEDKNA